MCVFGLGLRGFWFEELTDQGLGFEGSRVSGQIGT